MQNPPENNTTGSQLPTWAVLTIGGLVVSHIFMFMTLYVLYQYASSIDSRLEQLVQEPKTEINYIIKRR